MKKSFLFISLCYLSLLFSSVFAQNRDERKGFRFGLNMGMYFPSKVSANYYNGSGFYNNNIDPNGVRLYSIEERLNLTPQETQYITNFYNASGGFDFPRDSYPIAMRYNGGFNIGFQTAYDFNNKSSLIFDLNVCKVKAYDRFTMQLIGTSGQLNGQNDIRLFNVEGNEQRLNLALGYRTGWALSGNGLYFMQFGGSMLGTKVVNNIAYVADRNYDLIIGAANPAQMIDYRPQTGIGFGYYFSTGFFLPLGEHKNAELSLAFAKDKIILNANEFKGWNKMLTFCFSI
jgi:hypothetical protein